MARERSNRFERALPYLLGLSVVALGVLSYRDILGYFFTAPDALTQIDTGRIKSVGDIFRIFSEPMMNNTKLLELVHWYRPTAILSYGIDYAIWGLNPFGYHLTDLLLHVGVAVMSFALIRTLGGSLFVAWLGATLFVIHPVHVENVPAIARRHDAIAMFFMFIALFLFLRNYRSREPSKVVMALSLVAFALALGGKEVAPIFPVLLVGYCAIKRFPRERAAGWMKAWLASAIKPSIPYFALTLVYIAWRTYVVGGLGGEQSGHFEQTSGSLVVIVARYFRGLLDPYRLLDARTNIAHHIFFWVLVAAWSFWRFLRSDRSLRPARSPAEPLMFFAIWLLLPLAILLVTETFQIRRLYVPAIPMMAMLALVVSDAYAGARIALPAARAPQQRAFSAARISTAVNGLMLLVSFILCLSLLAYSPLVRNYTDWKNSAEFSNKFLHKLSALVPDLPNDAEIHIHDLPFKFLKSTRTRPFVQTPAGLLDYSVKSWLNLNHPENNMDVVLHRRRMVELPPEDVRLEVTRGEGNIVEIHVALDFVSAIDDVEDYRDVGASYADIEDYRNAIGYLETYVDSVPDDARGWGLLGEAYFGLDRKGEAERCLRRSLDLDDRDNYEGYYNLTILLREKRAFGESIELCLDWAKYMPEDAGQAYRGIAWAYSGSGNYEKAIEYLKKSLAIEKNTHTYWGLLTAYIDGLKQYGNAIKYARQWVEFDRRDANAYLMLGLACYNTGKLEAAIANLERSLELGQRREDARYRTYKTLATAKKEKGDARGGLEVLRDATVVFPDSADIFCRVAEAHAELGECDEAGEWLTRAERLRLSPGRRSRTADAIATCEQRRRR